MSRVVSSAARHTTVAILFMCMLALSLCQILGPTARLNHDLGPADLSGTALAGVSERASGVHIPPPSRCASIKLAPVEIKAIDLTPADYVCTFVATATSTPPNSAELGVPTPPPRSV